MTTELQQRIAAIKAECEKVIQDDKPLLARHQLCGCVVCVCDCGVRCHGCGSNNCGKHPAGKIPNPVYVASRNVSPAMARVVVAAIGQWVVGPELGYVDQAVADGALQGIANQWEGK